MSINPSVVLAIIIAGATILKESIDSQDKED